MQAQLGFSHEIGLITGPVAFQSDYGVRQDFETNAGNTGWGVGLVHYINFAYRADCNCYTKDSYFNDHFKLRNEISWNRTNLDHYGVWVNKDSNIPGIDTDDQLRALHGQAQVWDIGSQIEFFPYSIRDFAAGGYSFAPYVSLGAHYNSYNPKAYSDLGPIDNILTTPANFIGSYTNESASTWSVVWSAGVRYKLTPLSDLILDLRWQYYFSDWVDGWNHELDSNKYNDWNVWLNFGYIYYLD